MSRNVVACLLAVVVPLSAVGDDGKWVTVKGKFVWDAAKGPAPKRAPIKAEKDAELCAKDKEFLTEDWVIHPKSGGIKNVIVWLGPDLTTAQSKEIEKGVRIKVPALDPKDIHPNLAKPANPAVEMDQPCCRFIPHIVVMREGQDLVIKNGAPVLHNARFEATDSGIPFNQAIGSGQQLTIKGLKPERIPVLITCSIHPWMSAWLAVFSHPYFAVTDDEGNFEIKDAPVLGGKLRLHAYHESIGFHGGNAGRYGRPVAVKGPATDLGSIKLEFRDEMKEKK
jgi:hypothetical protein